MFRCKPVSVPNNALHFCRWTLTVILWGALILQSKWLVVLSFIILALSALLKIRKAPLVFLYASTADRLFPSEKRVVDENGMAFAHSIGALLALAGTVLLYRGIPVAGWVIVFLLAVLKTIGAFGFCTATKLYGCMASGGCCRLTGAQK